MRAIVIDQRSIVIDMRSMVIDLHSIVTDMHSVVIDMRSIVTDCAKRKSLWYCGNTHHFIQTNLSKGHLPMIATYLRRPMYTCISFPLG